MEKPEAIFEQYLAERNIPMVGFLKAVCREVFLIHNHFTLPQLQKRLNKIDAKRIEAALDHLECAGLVRKVILRGVEVYFEHTYGHIHHDHLVCVSCGKIVEFYYPGIEKAQEEAAATNGFQMLRHALRIEGLCSKCKTEKKEIPIAPLPHPCPGPKMPLSLTSNGQRVQIRTIRGGKELRRRLASMGIAQGDEIEILQNTFAGPITVRSRDCRIAIGHGMSHKIFVIPVS